MKHLSKQQILLLKQFKKEVFLKERELNAEQTNLIKNSFAINQLFCGSVNAFVLEKKKKDLLSLSKLALLGELELETLDLINKNSAFIDSCMRNRYKILEKNLANKDKISLFAYKEMELLSKRLKLNNDEFLRELSLKVINGDSKRKRKSNTKDFQTHSSNSKSKNSKSNFKDFTPNSEKARSFSSPR